MRRRWLGAAIAVVLLGAAAAWSLRTRSEVEVVTADVTKGTIVRRIFATGTLQATSTVAVGTQVSGIVESLQADFNTIVHANQVVAKLEPSLYQAALDQAKATLAQAKAAVVQSQADLAGLRTAEGDARTKLVRAEKLAASQLIPQADLDAARIAMDEATAAVRSGEAQVGDANAVVAQQEAAVSQASANLDHTVIHSPIDGIVLNRAVDVGQTVAAAIQAPVLFTIATDLTHLQVQLDVDQSDIAGIEVGQRVTFEVESYPDETFVGKVAQVRLQPIADQSTPATTIASSTIAPTTTAVATVVSYATMVDVDNPDERLRPGMTASVLLNGAHRDNALRIPNSALSFRPSQAVFAALGEAEPSVGEAAPVAGDTSAKPRDLWKFEGRRLTPLAVRTGLSDDQWTELVSGSLHAGDAIVTRADLRRRSRF
jgi:HlyD family secretion protein